MKETICAALCLNILWCLCSFLLAAEEVQKRFVIVSSTPQNTGRSINGTTDNQTPANQLEFDPTTFASTNKFFLGASNVPASGDQAKALSRVELKQEDGVWAVDFKPLAPANTCVVNGVANQTSPFNGNVVSLLTSTPAGLPVGVTDKEPTKVRLVTDTTAGQVVLQTVEDVKDANNQATAEIVAVGASDTYVLAAVSPNNGTFGGDGSGFASVKINAAGSVLINQRWDGTTSVDAAAYYLDKSGGNDDVVAGVVSIAKTTELQIPPSTSDIYYDAHLDRFYIALSDMNDEKNQATQALTGIWAGNESDSDRAAALLIAYPIDIGGGNKRLEIHTALNPDQTNTKGFANVNNDARNKIVVATRNNYVGLYKVRVMHTSTGKDYVIVNGGDSVNDRVCDSTKNNDDAARNYRHASVFAIPVMPKGSKTASKKDISGVIADASVDANNKFQVVQSNAGLPNALSAAYKVGADYKYLFHKADDNQIIVINDMQIIGDTVDVSLSSTMREAAGKNCSSETGIFSSTAIFDEYGTIRAWTPWRRVMGFPDVTKGFGFDTSSQNYWYLAGTGANTQETKEEIAEETSDITWNTVKETRWNKGDSASTGIHYGKPLSDVLNVKKIIATGGVLGMFTFDADTPGFKPYSVTKQEYPNFSMMVATGYCWVALIEVGRIASQGSKKVYDPTKEFTVSDFSTTATVYLFDATSSVQAIKNRSSELANLGNIVCAEVARCAPSLTNMNKGWLFVGGDNGIAVLRSDHDGRGWANGNNQGLGQLLANGYPVLDGTYSFSWKQITKMADGRTDLGINHVRRLTSDGTYLYILTRDALYRLFMDAATFKSGVLSYNTYFQEIVSISDAMDASGSSYLFKKYRDEFFDVLIVDDTFDAHKVVIATTKGLFINVDPITANASSQGKRWQPVKKADGTTDFTAAGPVLKIDFVNSKNGGVFVNNKAEGNIYALALDNAIKNINVYRFNVSNGTVKAFAEPYRSDDGSGDIVYTDYFYKMGILNEWLRSQLAFQGPLDLVATTEDYGSNNNDFISTIPMIPNPQAFLNAGQAKSAIDFNLDVVNFSQLRQCIKQPIDPASGAQYIPGQFGVVVNE